VTPLPDLLARAAGTEPAGFDAADVRARLVRRQRRQRVVLAAAVVLVALALGVGALALAGGGDPDSAPADRPGFGPVTVDELTAAPWVLTAEDGVAVEDDVAVSLLVHDDGTLVGDGGCLFSARWELDEGRLLTSEVRPVFPDCEPEPDPAHIEVFSAMPAVGRVAGRAGSLELRAGTDTLAWMRADRIGRAPLPEEIVGRWESLRTPITFRADGTLVVDGGVLGGTACEIPGTWALDDGRLTMSTPSSDESGVCELLVQAAEDPFDGTSTVRIEDDHLVVATAQVVFQLRR
jgi:hypothetical protein